MKILVTGAAGFIGYHLCEKLISLDHDIIGIDNINEINKKASQSNLSLQHLWITTKKDSESQVFLNVSMHHLGVKLALINSWKDIGDRLKYILTK